MFPSPVFFTVILRFCRFCRFPGELEKHLVIFTSAEMHDKNCKKLT